MSINAIHRAQSGLHVAERKLQSASHNSANMNTEGHRDERTEGVESVSGAEAITRTASKAGHDPTSNTVERVVSQLTYTANLAVLKTASEMQGELIDVKG